MINHIFLLYVYVRLLCTVRVWSTWNRSHCWRCIKTWQPFLFIKDLHMHRDEIQGMSSKSTKGWCKSAVPLAHNTTVLPFGFLVHLWNMFHIFLFLHPFLSLSTSRHPLPLSPPLVTHLPIHLSLSVVLILLLLVSCAAISGLENKVRSGKQLYHRCYFSLSLSEFFDPFVDPWPRAMHSPLPPHQCPVNQTCVRWPKLKRPNSSLHQCQFL